LQTAKKMMAAAQMRSSAIVSRDDAEINPKLGMTANTPVHTISPKAL
jgi:hypothetical protein